MRYFCVICQKVHLLSKKPAQLFAGIWSEKEELKQYPIGFCKVTARDLFNVGKHGNIDQLRVDSLFNLD